MIPSYFTTFLDNILFVQELMWCLISQTSPLSFLNKYFEYNLLKPNVQESWNHGGHYHGHSQPAITCSKLTIETLEKDVKYAQS